MTRSELIRALSIEYEDLLPIEDLEVVVEVVVRTLCESLIENRRAEFRGFGSFENRELGSRMGRNPKSGESVQLGERLVPSFKAGQDLRTKLVARGSA